MTSLSKSRAKVNAKRKLFLSNYPSVNASIYGYNQTNIMDLTPDKINYVIEIALFMSDSKWELI